MKHIAHGGFAQIGSGCDAALSGKCEQRRKGLDSAFNAIFAFTTQFNQIVLSRQCDNQSAVGRRTRWNSGGFMRAVIESTSENAPLE